MCPPFTPIHIVCTFSSVHLTIKARKCSKVPGITLIFCWGASSINKILDTNIASQTCSFISHLQNQVLLKKSAGTRAWTYWRWYGYSKIVNNFLSVVWLWIPFWWAMFWHDDSDSSSILTKYCSSNSAVESLGLWMVVDWNQSSSPESMVGI